MVDGHDARAAQRQRHIVRREPLREPFDDRRLADAGWTHQCRIVLAVTEQDVHHAGDLFGAASHRFETTFARIRGQVARIASENAVRLAGHGVSFETSQRLAA